MDEPLRVEESRISRTLIAWLAGLLLVNVLLAAMLWRAEAPQPQAPAPEAAEAGETLTLISELPEEERARREAVAAPLVASAAPPERLVCRAWGPFSDAALLESLQRELQEVGSALEVHSAEVAGEPDYLVFVSTGNSQDVARRTLAELETQSVDAYIIAGGPFVNAVSVGVFSEASRAELQRDRVAALGYDVTVQPLERAQTVYHLVALVPESYAFSAEGADSCEAIASLR